MKRYVDIVTILVFSIFLSAFGQELDSLEKGVVEIISDSVVDNLATKRNSRHLPSQETPHNKTRSPAELALIIEQAIPLPLPEWKPPKGLPVSENQVVSYNIETGVEKRTEIKADISLESNRAKGSIGLPRDILEDNYPPMINNFGGLEFVSNPEDFPWRVNCKLILRFNSTWYVASGVLIDPIHVLTAGHCVYDYGGAGWADEIIVIPGYENGMEPYGTANALQLHSWTGWINNGDFNHDMGVIDLDRHVGALTGWHGYGYNNNSSFFTTNTFHNPGYPAVSPYSGEYMYNRYGNFDEVYTYLLYFNNRSYGGQSGSGIRRYYSGDYTVYGEVSHTTISPPWWTGCVRITSSKYSSIGSWISGDTPSSFDLVALDINTSPPSINAGQQLTSLDFYVHNYSSVSWSGTVPVDIYLSTDNNISGSDTYLQTRQFTHSFGPKSSVRITPTDNLPVIPGNTPVGNYYIGIILDISDFDTSNNESDGDDASPIYVEEGGGDVTPPSPDPMTFESPPWAYSTTAIRMTAAEATDDTPPITYQFDFDESGGGPGGTDRGWSTLRIYTDGGLTANTEYSYRCRARDNASPPNTTAYSSITGTFTLANTPGAPQLSNVTTTTIDLNVDPNANPSYTAFAIVCATSDPVWDGKFVNALGNPVVSEVWQTDGQWSTITIQGLSPGTEYSFRVKAQNEDNIETEFGPQSTETTLPDALIPTLGEWGMVILALLLLAVGTIAIIRREKEAFANR